MKIYRYNIDNKLVQSVTPIDGQTDLDWDDQKSAHCLGFDSTGEPIFNLDAIRKEAEIYKSEMSEQIKRMFEYDCEHTGVIFEGIFETLENDIVENPHFQYDTDSRNLLLEAKDDARIPYWRCVENRNVILNNTQKNELYELLKFTYFTRFAESRQAIDRLTV